MANSAIMNFVIRNTSNCIISLLSLFLFAQYSVAQSIEVKYFVLDKQDLDAINYEKRDQNGIRYALVKIRTTESGFLFDAGYSSIEQTLPQTNVAAEIWLYVEHGAKRITISHPKFGQIEYLLNEPIEQAKVYVMELVTAKVSTVVFDKRRKRRLLFATKPDNAKIFLNGALFHNGDEVFNGEYEYVVEADRYHNYEGYINVVGNGGEQKVGVSLKPMFGWLRLSRLFKDNDVSLFIDGGKLDTHSQELIEVMNGLHSVRVEKALYQPYDSIINVQESQVVDFEPNLVENYGVVTLNAGKDAEIWVDGRKMGIGQWRGKLEAKEHLITCKKLNHTSTNRTIIVANRANETITLDAPSPNNGWLSVSSEPSGARIYVDNILKGETPCNQYLIEGSHSVRLVKDNCEDAVFMVNISKDETINKSIKMTTTTMVNLYFENYGQGAYAIIDNQEKIWSYSVRKPLSYGRHKIKMINSEGKSRTRRITVDKNHNKFFLRIPKVREVKTNESELYVDLGYTIYSEIPNAWLYSTFGANINLLNFEIGFSLLWTDFDDIELWDDRSLYEFVLISPRIGLTWHGSRNRLTPQLGLDIHPIRDFDYQEGFSSENYGGCMTRFVATMRYDLMIGDVWGIFIAPEISAYNSFSKDESVLPNSWKEKSASLKFGIHWAFSN